MILVQEIDAKVKRFVVILPNDKRVQVSERPYPAAIPMLFISKCSIEWGVNKISSVTLPFTAHQQQHYIL